MKVVWTCDECGRNIYEDDLYIEFNGYDNFCSKSCFRNFIEDRSESLIAVANEHSYEENDDL